MGLDVKGAENFKALATSLRSASATLEQDMLEAVQRSVEPLRQSIPASARATLPKRGGLAARVAASQITIRRTGSGVSVLTRNGYQIKAMDQGRVRHPVWGNRSRWVTQPVPPAWWTKPTTAIAPKIRRAGEQELKRIVSKIGK